MTARNLSNLTTLEMTRMLPRTAPIMIVVITRPCEHKKATIFETIYQINSEKLLQNFVLRKK